MLRHEYCRHALATLCAVALGCTTTPPPESGETANAGPPAGAPSASQAASAAAPALDAPVVADTASGTLGFVVSRWYDALPEVEPGHCPDGMNPTEAEYFDVDMAAFQAAAKEMGYGAAQKKFYPPDACQDPTAQSDPGFKTFDGAVVLAGLDLDGVDSQAEADVPCAHDDFAGPNGEAGVDSQHLRLVGCTSGYQPDGQIDRLYQSGNFVKEGFPILMELRGVDDPKNDDDVEFRIFSSAEPVSLDTNGEVLRDLSLPVHEDPRFWSASATGRIEDGVLTTEPVDLRLRFKQQVIDGEFFYRDARVRAELLPDGKLRGILGFYWDADNFYRVNNDHWIGENHSGRIAAQTRGYMCAGIYHAIERVADGHYDPATGKCTSISAQMHFEGTPAFVIEREATASAPEAPVS